ncbi:MAG: hypothetical protein JST26_19030 [Bacteroidetes bacterium]|nr:hypothetical protein [Bacteroidota bacterium]
MKKLSFLFVFLTSLAFAQSVPQGINYQAIARDAAGAIMANQSVTVKFRIFKNFGASSTPDYEEDHAITTSPLGYFNLIIGQGTPVTGTFSSVLWSTGNASYEIYLNGSLLGSETKFFSTPYALYAQQAGNASAYQAGTGIAINSGTIINTAPNQTVNISGSPVSGAYPNYSISSPSLSVSGNSLSISNGNTVTIGGLLAPGTANGNTLFWNNSLSAWQESTNLVNDGLRVGIGISNPSGAKLHVHNPAAGDSSGIFVDHLSGTSRTAGIRSFAQGTSTTGQYAKAIMGGHFKGVNSGTGPGVGVLAEGQSIVAGATSIGLFATSYGLTNDRWAAIFDKGGVRVNDSLLLGSAVTPGNAGDVIVRTGTGRMVWANPSGFGDNLGNHTLTQNLKTAGKFISNDGDPEGLWVSVNGQAGIGTSSPLADFDVSGNICASGSRLFLGNMYGVNSGYTGIYESAGDLRLAVFKSGGGTTGFGNNTMDALSIKNNSGYVGIKTINPTHSLHVRGDIYTDSLFSINGVSTYPPASASGEGRVFFDGQKFKVSENGGPYFNAFNAPVNFSANGIGNASIANGSVIPITFSTTNYNGGGGFGGTVFTAPAPGVYHFDGCVTMDATTATGAFDFQLQIMYGGGTYRVAYKKIPAGQTVAQNNISVDIQLNAGDQVQLGVYHNWSAALPVYAPVNYSYFTGHKVN